LGEKVIRVMETVPDYTDLLALYEQQKKLDDAAGKSSVRGRKLLARLNRLRIVAGSASSIDPENPTGPKVVNLVWGRGGWMDRFHNALPLEDAPSEESRRGLINVLCRFVLE